MLSELEIDREIESCQQQPITLKQVEALAMLYIVKDHMYPAPAAKQARETARTAAEPSESNTVHAFGATEFIRAIDGKPARQVWSIVDDAIDMLKVVQPKAYDSILSRLKAI